MFFGSSSSYNNTEPKLSRKAIPSLPGYGSLELHWKPGAQSSDSSITELIGFISSLLQLLCQVTKLHKGVAAKVCVFCSELSVSLSRGPFLESPNNFPGSKTILGAQYSLIAIQFLLIL